MQSATGQYSTQAGEPAHPVQHSVITASSLGFFLRGVVSPVDLGSNFSSSGTIPAALVPVVSAGIGSPRVYREILPYLSTTFLGEETNPSPTVTTILSIHHNFQPPISAILALPKE